MKRLLFILLPLLLAATAPSRAASREVIPLNEGWRFFFKSENSSDNARHVTLPHSWNTDPRCEGTFLETTGNYQNTIFIPAEWSARRLFVKFYGAQRVADLFVNGVHAGSHRGGGTAFTFEITDKVRFGVDNALLVVVNNGWRDDVLPTSTDMNLYGGLYRTAELIVTDPVAISPLYYGSEGILVRPRSVAPDQAEGDIEVHLSAKGANTASITLDITAPDGRRVFSRRQRVRLDGKPAVIPFAIDSPDLWCPDRPALYTVSASVGDDRTDDSVAVRTGFRALSVSAGEGLRINDRRIPLHGVTLHHDNAAAGGLLAPADYDDDLALLLDLGANALRSAVMPHDPYLYDRCDELGVLVWIDLPLCRAPFLGDIAYFATPQFEQNGEQLLREIIAQNINHPSVVMWGLFSRLWTRGDNVIPYLRRLNELAHKIDPARPTVACSDQDGEINFITDLIVWRQNVGWKRGSTDDIVVWRDQLRKHWSHLRSGVTYGGSGFPDHRSYTAQSANRLNWMPEENQTRFHEEYARNLQNDSLFWGTWIANLCDYGSARRPYGLNASGLVTLDRRTRKDAFYLYRALWNDRRPTLRLVDKRHTLREEGRHIFRIYSSAGRPVLYVGRDTVALREYARCQYRSDSVALRGSVVVKACAGGMADSVTIRAGNALKPRLTQAPLQIKGLQKTN